MTVQECLVTAILYLDGKYYYTIFSSYLHSTRTARSGYHENDKGNRDDGQDILVEIYQ